MAHCPPGYTHDNFGNCVYSPIDYTQDPLLDWAIEDISDIETFFTTKGLDWGEYEPYFEDYEDSSWWEKEQKLRTFAGIDIQQQYDTWGLTSSQLLTGWDQRRGDLYETWYGEGDYIGEKARLENLITGTETMWGLVEGNIGTREETALGDWQFTQRELDRLRGEYGTAWTTALGGLEEDWQYSKEGIGLGTRGALLQSGEAQSAALRSIGFATAGTTAFDRMQRDIREGYIRDIEEGERKLGYNVALGEFGLSQQYANLGWDPETGEWGGGQYESGKRSYDTVMAGLSFERTMGKEKYDDEIARLTHMVNSGQLTYQQAYDQALLTYNDAVASGEMVVGMSITDIGQALEMNIWETQQAWRDEQTAMLNSLIQGGAFNVCIDADGNTTSMPESGVCPEGSTETITTCDDEDANNYGAEGPCEYDEDLETICSDGSPPPCEVMCPDGTMVSDVSMCSTYSNMNCWTDNTGNIQCDPIDFDFNLDFDLGIDLGLDSFGIGLNQSDCADRGGTWNQDTGECEGATWNIFDPDAFQFDDAMNTYCANADPNSYWDGSQCVATAPGPTEGWGTDINQTYTDNDCEAMNGVGYSGDNINACVDQESIADFSNCINADGTIQDCAELLLAIGTTNPWIAVGATLAEELGILDALGFNMPAYGTPCSAVELANGCITKQDRVYSGYGLGSDLVNYCYCPGTGGGGGGGGGGSDNEWFMDEEILV